VWLWDANVVRAYSDREAEGHERVLARGRTAGWGAVGLPVVVVSELLEGRLGYLREAHRLAPRQLIVAFRHLEKTLEVLSAFAAIPFDEEALEVYTRRRLFPGTMSRNDRLIAAIALAGRHVLVTRNMSHFLGVPGLLIENWIDDEP
jgi:predicted nucleic acid-binding protein